ncbi:MAG: peptidase domain-containing ABC transporter [Bacilli bacterium]|nr:peptidase domain-containing ABC transporter [Bacilli bacterium]
MKKNLIVLQDGYKECGAASLLSIIHYYKGSISMARLVELTNTNKEGTNFYQLKQAAEKLGFNANGYKTNNYNTLQEIETPFIIQIIDKNYEHFCVVYTMKKNKVVVMDPAIGQREILIEEFKNIWTGYILILRPIKKIETYQETKYLNTIIKEILIKNKSMIFTILFLSLFYTIFSCICSFYLQFIIDFIIESTKNNLLIITFIFGILSLFKIISSLFRNQTFIIFSQKLDYLIFLRTFKKIILLPYSYYHSRTTGEMISRLNDLIYVKNFVHQLILTVCLDGIILIASGMTLILMNVKMFLFMVMIILIYFAIFLVFRPWLEKYTKLNQQNNAAIQSFLTETISGIETIKNMNIESTINERMETLYLKSLNDNFFYQNINTMELFLKELITTIGTLLFQFIGIYFVMNQKMTLGYLMSLTALANCFLEPIINFIQLNKEYFYSKNSLKRINHLFEVKEENLYTKTNFVADGKISFQNLSFSYNQEKNILESITFDISKGNKVIILGDSGSGKSTILKLLLKYYEINRNMIYLNGIDLNNYSISDVRNSIGLMSQNEILYTDTILNNITLYQEIDSNKWLDICKITYVDDFVKKFFLGYQTKLEENGLNLSGGQRQRLLLARLLLQEKKIILIDEGLNAVDVNLERKILKNIFSKYPDKTIIVVSHRRENLDLFDQTLYFSQGKLLQNLTKQRKEKKLC